MKKKWNGEGDTMSPVRREEHDRFPPVPMNHVVMMKFLSKGNTLEVTAFADRYVVKCGDTVRHVKVATGIKMVREAMKWHMPIERIVIAKERE